MNSIILSIISKRDKLYQHWLLANRRADLLGHTSNTYDNNTIDTQTPEECNRLNRLIDVSNKAHELASTLKWRIELLEKAISALEEESEL